jgi:ParB family chromosome partitioning protein
MAELKRVLISDIYIGDRLREIDEDHARAIGRSMAAVGQLQPISIRSTPAQKGGKYTLVFGGHRLVGARFEDMAELDAFVVKADGRQAQLLEIAENLFRNDLSVIDRAIFVQQYRELWENEHGEIKAGRPSEKLGHGGPIVEAGFSQHVADRLGISERSAKRLNTIAHRLHPELRSALRHTQVADQTTMLEKLAKMEPAMQRRAAIAYRDVGDIKQALTLISDKRPVDKTPDEILFEKLVDLWSRSNANVKDSFLSHIGLANETTQAAE